MTETTTPPAAAAPPPADPQQTFTQAEVDVIVKRRADRVAADKYSDYGDLKAKAKRLDDIEQANASELEKAVMKARSEGAAEVTGAVNQRLVAAEARALAAEAKFRSPMLAVRAIDLAGVTVGDDGDVDAAAIKTLLSDLATAEPYLVDDGKLPRPKPDATQGRSQGEPSKAEEGRAEARKRFGPPAGSTTQQ